eukprot:TRINITY_DN50418_c0_g1_i1.p2 TRINITY_DN50418_c0_g1~~TRINITY_DN50418_c0_g1_i1.p2  ORF type:complete len:139 (-),score=29.33 TRINITY_DN50418_c0_g1_i1:16-432(-)
MSEQKKSMRAEVGVSKSNKKGKTRLPAETAIETTIHLSKYLKGRRWKQRAPLSIMIVKTHAKKIMHTEDVRIDSKLNQYLWSRGIKGVPRRVRIMLKRQKSVSDKDKHKKYTLAQLVPIERGQNMKGLQTKVIELAEE